MAIHGTLGAVSGSLKIGTSGAAVTTVLDEDNMSTDSATALATQQSIKAYVDASTPDTLGAIGNVNTTDVSKAAGHVLVWDNSSTRWENAAISGTSNEVDITLADGAITVGMPDDVTVTGNLTIGSDADGSDRRIIFGHGTLKSTIGIDDNQDVFAINTNATLDNTNDLEIDASGNVTIKNGDLFVRGGDIHGASAGSLKLRADTNVLVYLDDDNNGSHEFRVLDGNENIKFKVDESGNTTIDGDLTVEGGNIGKDGTAAIVINSSENVQIANGRLSGPTDATFNIDSDGDMEFQVDKDGDGTNKFVFKSGTGVEIADLDESGNLQIDGNLTIGNAASGVDQHLAFDGNAQDFYVGIDDTDDELKIGHGLSVGTAAAITISSGSYVQLTKGNKFSPSIRVTPNAGDGASLGKFSKIAEHKDGLSVGNYDVAIGTFLVAFSGLGHASWDVLHTFIVQVQWGEDSNSVNTDSPATHVSVQELDYHLQSDPSGNVTLLTASDFTLTYNGTSEAGLWVKCPTHYGAVSVSHLGGTSAEGGGATGHGSGKGWTVCTPENTVAWQTAITNLGALKTGELAKKKFAQLELGGTTSYVTSVRDEDNMSSNDAFAIATQQSIKAYVDAWGFVLEDADGTEVEINKNKEIKFVGVNHLAINWTDTSDGSDGDPYDLTFTLSPEDIVGDQITGDGANRIPVLGGDSTLTGNANLTYDGTDLKLVKAGEPALIIEAQSTTTNQAGQIHLRRVDTGGTLTTGDNLGEIFFVGSEDGSNYANGAAIISEVDESTWVQASSTAGRIKIQTTPDGTTTLRDAILVDSSQNTTLYGSLNIVPPDSGGANLMGYMRLYEEPSNGSNYLQLQADGHVAASDIVVNIPAHNGSLLSSGETAAQSVGGALTVGTDLTVTDDLFVNDFARIDALRVGTTSTDPGDGNLYVENRLQVNGAANNVGIAAIQCENNSNTGGFTVIEASGGGGETTRIWHDGTDRRIDGGAGDGTIFINKPHTGVGIHVGGEVRVQHTAGQADFVARGTPSNNVGDGDNFGGLYFYGSENDTNFANVGGVVVESAANSWNYSSNAHSKMKFWVNHGAGTAEVLYIDGSDASVDPKVGINTGTPTAYLHVLAVNRGTDDGIPAALIDGHTGYSASQGVLKVHSQDTGCQSSDVLLRIESSDVSMTNSCYFIGFYTDSELVGGIDSEVAYDTFTGCHPTDILPEDVSGIRQGMILKSTGEVFHRDSGISNAWCRTKATSSAKDKAAVGVYNKLSAWGVSKSDEIINPTPEGRQYHMYNAIGEGQILVTDEGGNIETGDYICSSNRSGHGMLQDDDLLHNYTVAKATEPVDFSTVDIDPELGFKSKLVACTYHAG